MVATQLATRNTVKVVLLAGACLGVLGMALAAVRIATPRPVSCRPQSRGWQLPDQAAQAAALARLQQATAQLSLQGRAVRQVAPQRYADLQAVAAAAPERALALILQPSTRRAVTADPSCLEQPTEAEGTLEVLESDDFQHKTAQTRYFLRTADGKREILPANGLKPGLLSGSRLRVSGYSVGTALLTDGMTDLSTAQPTQEPVGVTSLQAVTESAVTGVRHVLVVPIEWHNTSNSYPSHDYLTKRLNGGAAPSVEDYYYRNSYSSLDVYGDVVATVQLNINKTCDVVGAESSLFSALLAANPTLSLSGYTNVAFLMPLSGCPFGGMGTLGPEVTWTTRGYFNLGVSWDASDVTLTATQLVGLMVHELGHNFGTHHANYLDCGSAVIGQNCTDVEYGDYDDVMGGAGNAAHMSVSRKLSLGWLTDANILDVASTRSVLIAPRATDSTQTQPGTDGVKGVRVQTGGGRTYMLEYRAGRCGDWVTYLAFDPYDSNVFDATDMAYGAVAVEIPHPQTDANSLLKTELIDPIKNDVFGNHYLPIQQPFTDEYGVTITLLERTCDYAKVSIVVPPGLFNQPPVLAVIPNKVAYAGQTLSFTLQASDPNGDHLTFSSPDLPSGAYLSSDGHFLWSPMTTSGYAYNNIVTFVVKDGRGGVDSQQVVIQLNSGPGPTSSGSDGVSDWEEGLKQFLRKPGMLF